MPRYFLDSSALAKAYHAETGTAKVVALLAETGSEFFISSLSVVEIQSVFSQKVRDGKISDADYTVLKQRFAAETQSKRIIVKNLLRPHQKTAEKLLEKHAIRLALCQLAPGLRLQREEMFSSDNRQAVD